MVNFGEKYLSPDNYFDPKTVLKIEKLFTIFILFTITSSIFLFLNLKNKILLLLNSYFQTSKAIKFFLTDAVCSKKQLSLYILVIGLMSGFFLHFYLLLAGQPTKEGTLEKYSSWLFLVSILILIISSIRINRKLYSPKALKKIMFMLIIISGIFLLIFGEEISWGQQIFHWDSFGVFEKYNFQKETNIHNFFNPFYKYIYPIVGMGSFMILFFIWFFPKKKKTYLFDLFFPHSSLFFLAFIMACSSFGGHSETYEELLAVFALLYSIRIFMCLSFPRIDLNLQKKY